MRVPTALRRARRPSTPPSDGATTLAELACGRYDFVDLGASAGGSLEWCARRLGGRGLGVDTDPAKVERARAAGCEAIAADALTALGEDDVVRYVSMMDFLEHLPDLATVEAVLERAAAAARDFLFIRHPSFEGEGFVEQMGVWQYWWNWRGHSVHPQVADYCAMFERLGLRAYTILFRGPVPDSSHPTVLPLGTPNGQHEYDPAVHPPKPQVTFLRPLWRRQDILVALRAFDPAEWRRLVAAVDA